MICNGLTDYTDQTDASDKLRPLAAKPVVVPVPTGGAGVRARLGGRGRPPMDGTDTREVVRLSGVPPEQKMLKGHLPRVVEHPAY